MLLPAVKVEYEIVVAIGEQIPSISGLGVGSEAAVRLRFTPFFVYGAVCFYSTWLSGYSVGIDYYRGYVQVYVQNYTA
jgi:hypothetical protein